MSPYDHMHAWVEPPHSLDRYAIFVTQYEEGDTQHGWLLCGDGIWRKYHAMETFYGDLTPTVQVQGIELGRHRENAGQLLRDRVAAFSYGVQQVIREAVLEPADYCVPTWMKDALS